MKKLVMAAAALLSFSIAALAQAYEGTIEYDKKKQAAVVIDYAYSTEAVENAIIEKMQRMGYKSKEEKGMFNKDKGFRVFKGAMISDISDNSMDYIVNVERKSRKDKDESTLYLVMNKNGENVSSSVEMGRAKDFLNGLLPEVEASNLELQIKDQEEMVTKAEKKLKNLRDDQDDLEKKLKNNQKDQEDTQKNIEDQKHALENLRAKRRS